MDDVFGNSSTETVVCVQDLEAKHASENLQDSLEGTAGLDVIDFHEPEETTQPNPERNIENWPEGSEGEALPQNIRVSVIKCVKSIQQQTCSGESVFKVPLVPSGPLGPLRHTQSAVSQRHSCTGTRTRVNSTSSAPRNGTYLKNHPYQNIPVTSSLPHISTPSYVNLPSSYHATKPISNSPVNNLNNSNSAPSTPRGSRNCVRSRRNNSYIQLWTGIKQMENSAAGSEPLSGTGYVSMSSPYLRSPNSSILSDLAGHFSTFAGMKNTKDIFCPFCPRPFTNEQNLKHHIQAIHRHELQKIACGHDPIIVQYCPLCHARFFYAELLPGHLLEFHREDLIDLLDKHEPMRLENGEVKCHFCTKKVPGSNLGEEILLYHLLQIHCSEYEDMIRSLFKPVECRVNKDFPLPRLSSEDLAQALSFKPALTSTPGLSLKFNGLSCQAGSTISASTGSLLEETWSSHCAPRCESNIEDQNRLPNQMVNKGILRSQPDLSRKPSVKRELRFSIPPVTSEEIFIPESPETSQSREDEESAEQDENVCPHSLPHQRQNMPVRIDSLSSADFMELNDLPIRKKRRLGIGLKSKKSFKKKKKEPSQLVGNVFDSLKSIGCGKSADPPIVTTAATRTFRKPKPVPPPTVPVCTPSTNDARTSVPPPPSQVYVGPPGVSAEANATEDIVEASPFGNMKLYSPLRMFRCNSCRVKYCDNESLGTHIRSRHRGFLGLLRPQFGCGICSAKFYENKYLVKHCLQHHTSLLEIRSPQKHKITIYRFSQD